MLTQFLKNFDPVAHAEKFKTFMVTDMDYWKEFSRQIEGYQWWLKVSIENKILRMANHEQNDDLRVLVWVHGPNVWANYWTVGVRYLKAPGNTDQGVFEIYYPKIFWVDVLEPEWEENFVKEVTEKFHAQYKLLSKH